MTNTTHRLFLIRSRPIGDFIPGHKEMDTTRRDIPLDIAFGSMRNRELEDPIEVGEWNDPQCEITKLDSNWPAGLPETGGAAAFDNKIKKGGRRPIEGKPRIVQSRPKV